MNSSEKFNKNIEKLYKAYPILKDIDINREIIEKNIVFKELFSDEYLKTSGENCAGFLFVINGVIKIQKMSEDGNETNLYNIESGELCHEALSCFINFKSLNIEGRAIKDSLIALLSPEVVNKYLLCDVRFMQVIYKDLYVKFREVIENKEARIHESLEKRLIKLLLSRNINIIYATHNEIAFELDSSREVISRKLKELEKKGYLEISRGKIKIIKDLKNI